MTRLVPLPFLAPRIPYARTSLHVGRCKGRYPWLVQLGPDGRRVGHLWVDLEMLAEWGRVRRLTWVVAALEFAEGPARKAAQ